MKRIFTFHAIDYRGDVLSISPESFANMMRFLAENGLSGCSLSGQMSGAALTFDDGYASFYENALHILKDFGFSATVFVMPNAEKMVGSGRPLLNGRQIKEIHDEGFEIGVHTLTHPDLTRLDSAALQREVVDAKHILEDKLGSKISSFAYPFGKYDPPSAALVAQHYEYAVTTDLRIATASDAAHLLPRIETYYLRAKPLQHLIASQHLPRYLQLRAIGRRLRNLR